jgi:hypothetical protein
VSFCLSESTRAFDDNGCRGRPVTTKIWTCGGGWAVAEWGRVGRGRGGSSAEVAANGVEVPGGEQVHTSGGWRRPNLTGL